MTDDNGRNGRTRHERETDEFGGPLFGGDEARSDERGPSGSPDDDTGGLSFGPTDTGPLPHWTDPPTGEIPRVEPTNEPAVQPADEDVDVWSSFTSESPVWRDDAAGADPTGPVAAPDPSGGFGLSDPSGGFARPPDASGAQPPVDLPPTEQHNIQIGTGRDPSGPVRVGRREPSRIQIGTDPSGIQRRESPGPRRQRGAAGGRSGGSARSGRSAAPARGRDMPTAIVAAVVIAGLFVGAAMWRPVAVLAIIVAVIAVASYEYFSNVAARGYRPVIPIGILACVAAPLAAYFAGGETPWLEGEAVLPLVVALAFVAAATSFIGADGVESGPLPNMAITMMGVVWIGMLGSFAVLILRYSTLPGSPDIGTDTLVLVALGVAANDIGALFIGSSTGRTPLRPWISPGKSLEGLIGGTVMTIVTLMVVGLADLSETWHETTHLVLLAIVISVMAPLGDLTASMFKRNLDVKDFGTLMAGHGGFLDRFDGFLFALPAVYYLTVWLQPWS